LNLSSEILFSKFAFKFNLYRYNAGPCDAAKYPIAKKKISLEFLREKIHLRTRTNTIGRVGTFHHVIYLLLCVKTRFN
jgi:hypothetical protein